VTKPACSMRRIAQPRHHTGLLAEGNGAARGTASVKRHPKLVHGRHPKLVPQVCNDLSCLGCRAGQWGRRQGKGMEPPMHTDAHRWSESGTAIHGDRRKTNPGERRRSGGPCPIGVHRCASVVPNFCLVARRSRPPEVITTSRTPIPIRAAVPYARACSVAAEPHAPEAIARAVLPTVSPRSAHETMARLARDRSVRYSI
jgi:hypothetical protein